MLAVLRVLPGILFPVLEASQLLWSKESASHTYPALAILGVLLGIKLSTWVLAASVEQ